MSVLLIYLPGVYVVCSEVFNDVASVAKLLNGLFGLAGGGGIAIATPALVPWPGCGCVVTGLPVSISVKSSCRNKLGKWRNVWLIFWSHIFCLMFTFHEPWSRKMVHKNVRDTYLK